MATGLAVRLIRRFVFLVLCDCVAVRYRPQKALVEAIELQEWERIQPGRGGESLAGGPSMFEREWDELISVSHGQPIRFSFGSPDRWCSDSEVETARFNA